MTTSGQYSFFALLLRANLAILFNFFPIFYQFKSLFYINRVWFFFILLNFAFYVLVSLVFFRIFLLSKSQKVLNAHQNEVVSGGHFSKACHDLSHLIFLSLSSSAFSALCHVSFSVLKVHFFCFVIDLSLFVFCFSSVFKIEFGRLLLKSQKVLSRPLSFLKFFLSLDF